MEKILLEPDLKSDQVHPNQRGYEVMARAVTRLIKKAAKD